MQEILGKAFEACKILEEKLYTNLEDLREAFSVLAESGDRARIDVSRFFNEIRRVLNERESHLKQKLRDQQNKEEGNLKRQQERYEEHLKKIHDLYDEYETSVKESDIELLENCLRRQEKMLRATENVDSIDFSLPFAEMNPQSELALLQKNLMNLFPAQKLSNQQNYPTLQSQPSMAMASTTNILSNPNSTNKTRPKVQTTFQSSSNSGNSSYANNNRRTKNISTSKEVSSQKTSSNCSKYSRKNENMQPISYSQQQGPASPIKLSVNLSGQGYFDKKSKIRNSDVNTSETNIVNTNCASPFNMHKKEM